MAVDATRGSEQPTRRMLSRASCVAVLVLAGIAGCGGGGHAADSVPRHGSVALRPSPVSAVDAARQRARDQRATDVARRLAMQVPRLPGEHSLAAAPAGLTTPNETIGADNLITEAHYWVIRRTPLQVYRAMKRSPSAPHQLTGFGAPGAGDDAPNRAFLSYDSPALPAYIQGGEISVEIMGRGERRTVIASFAEVYTHPVRTKTEHIDAAGSTGSYSWPRLELGKVVAHVAEPLSQPTLRDVVRNVNASPVANGPNVCFGGLSLAGDAVTVRINADGHAWKLVYPGTSCEDLSVSRDGTELAALSPNRSLRHTLRVLEHVGAGVKGTLLAVGGPVRAVATPENGTITLRAGGHVVAREHTYGSGRFFLLAHAGRYILSGSTPAYRIDGRPGRCVARHRVTIRTSQPVHANVFCQRR